MCMHIFLYVLAYVVCGHKLIYGLADLAASFRPFRRAVATAEHGLGFLCGIGAR